MRTFSEIQNAMTNNETQIFFSEVTCCFLFLIGPQIVL